MIDQSDWPIRKKAEGEYNIKGNRTLATCFVTDFFLPGADEWHKEAWLIIREWTDIEFLIPTGRIDRLLISLSSDWGRGYNNVNIGCTVENQKIAGYRLLPFLSHPIKWRFIACTPLLEAVGLSPYLYGMEHATVGSETGREVQECGYDWVLDTREQYVKTNVTFWFKNTSSFFKQRGIVEKVNPCKQNSLARELGTDISSGKRLFQVRLEACI